MVQKRCGVIQRKPRHGQSLPAVRHIRTHKAIKFKSRTRESCAECVLRSVNVSLTSFWQRCSAREGPGFCKGDGVLPLTRARRCSAWQDKSPRELRERLVAHSSSAVALIVFIGTYFAAAAIYFAVIDFAHARCLLCPQKRTFVSALSMSALCHKQTSNLPSPRSVSEQDPGSGMPMLN